MLLAILAGSHALVPPSARAEMSRRSAIAAGLAGLLARPDDAVAGTMAAATITMQQVAAANTASDADDPEALEDKFLAALKSGAKSEADRLARLLEDRGGSQRALAEGPGAFEIPWVGGWNVYASGVAAAPDRLQFKSSGKELRLVASRQFVFGPANAKEELKGIGREGGVSTEWIYAAAACTVRCADADDEGTGRVLIVKSGSLVKLPDFGYRAEYSQPAQTFRYDAATLSSSEAPVLSQLPADVLEAARLSGTNALLDLSDPASTKLRGALAMLDVGGLCRISYFSERLWLSRSTSSDGALTVLQRSGDRALAPPATRPDLTAPCAETGIEKDLRGGPLCRQSALF